jgi:hypothetical protein
MGQEATQKNTLKMLLSLSKCLALFPARKESIGDSFGEGRPAKERQAVGGGIANMGKWISITFKKYIVENNTVDMSAVQERHAPS